MGGCFSVSMSCDQTVNQFSRWLCLKGSYIHNLAENLVSLEKAIGELKAKRDDVQGRVHREEFTGHRQRLAQVQVWLTRILDIENQSNDLLSTSKPELESLCMCGFYSKNIKLSYSYRKRVTLVLREVESLISQGEFDVVTEATPRSEVEELPTHPTIVGQETTLERVWNRLTKDTVGIVGLHGMGGVGLNNNISGLPEQISSLASLRCLDLSWTQIARLPVGIQELKMLIHLNLEETKVGICDGISKLSRLRTLKLLKSQVWLDMSLMKELQTLDHLEFVSINIFSSWVGKLLLYDPRVGRCIQHIASTDFPEEESEQVFVLPAMDTLSRICIGGCGMREIKVEKTTWNNKTPTMLQCFSNLSKVRIGGCDGLKDLTWLLLAPNLTHLSVFESQQLEEIISKDKAASVLEKEGTCLVPFKNLEAIRLDYLPELKSIFWSALPFQRLKSFSVVRCLKLRKLPLDSNSIPKVENFFFRFKEEWWMQGIEWEDEATRNRFLPTFKLLPHY